MSIFILKIYLTVKCLWRKLCIFLLLRFPVFSVFFSDNMITGSKPANALMDFCVPYHVIMKKYNISLPGLYTIDPATKSITDNHTGAVFPILFDDIALNIACFNIKKI